MNELITTCSSRSVVDSFPIKLVVIEILYSNVDALLRMLHFSILANTHEKL